MNGSLVNNGTDHEEGNDDLVYTLLTAVVSSLSLLGGIGICLIYLLFKDLRSSGRTLLLYLSTTDAVTAFGNILGVIWLLDKNGTVINGNMAYCKIQSVMTIYSSNSSFCWTVIMGLSLFMTIVKSKQNFTTTYMKIFHAVSWTFPGVVSVFALAFDVLGYDRNLKQASWCWIDPAVSNAILWQLFTGKIWEISAYIMTCILYFTVVIYIKRKSKTSLAAKRQRRSKKASLEEANRKLMFVPLVFIVCRIWGTLRFLIGNLAHDYASKPAAKWIVPLQGVGDSAQGFANFILYCCMTDTIRNRLLGRCCKRSVDQATASHHSVPPRSLKRSTVDVISDIPNQLEGRKM